MPKHNIVERFFDGQPVVDAKRDLRVFVTQRDIQKGRRKEPRNCVFVQACHRLFGSNLAAFLRMTAYVDLPDARGRLKVNRFILSKDVRKQIAKLDKTGKADPGGFLLRAPSPGCTLAHKMAYARKREREIESGKRIVEPRRRLRNAKPKAMGLEVRDGRGYFASRI